MSYFTDLKGLGMGMDTNEIGDHAATDRFRI